MPCARLLLLILPKQEIKKIQPTAEITLKEWDRGENGIKIAEKHQIHLKPLSMEEGIKEGLRLFCCSERQKTKSRSKDKRAGERKSKVKRDTGSALLELFKI